MISKEELKKAGKAYDRGEMPISAWTRHAFIATVKARLGYVPEWVKYLPKIRMYDYLTESGVYPTGNCRKYRLTKFFMVDIKKIMAHCA